jgi:hypothetical protein
MSIGTAIRQLRPVTPAQRGLGWKSFSIAHKKAAYLGRPTVLQLLTPQPIKERDLSGFGEDPPAPNAWDNTNKAISALSSTIGAGTKFYVEQQQTKMLQSQAEAAARQTEAAQRALKLDQQAQAEAQRAAMLAAANAPKGLPSWVLPVAIGGVLIAALGGYFIFKKKAASP